MFNNHFREFLELLEKRKAKYLLIGGYAVGFHGFPRHTGDMGIFVAVDPENAQILADVFAGFGFAKLGLTPDDFLEADTVVEIGREPMKIQVLTGIDGVTFNQCDAGRVYYKASETLQVPSSDLKNCSKTNARPRAAKTKLTWRSYRKFKGLITKRRANFHSKESV